MTGERWLLWIGLVAVSFGMLEAWALLRHGQTLSAVTLRVFHGWPIVAVLYGTVFGGLAVHFAGWCP